METPWDGDPRAARRRRSSRIFITHMHPDHVGGAEAAAEATGAPVFQGRLDYAQCERVWGSDDWPERIAEWFLRNGVPPDGRRRADRVGPRLRRLRALRLEPDARRAGRRASTAGACIATPGHADGHLVPAPRRRADRGRHAADADHAGDRALPGEPARPARRLPRVAPARLASSRRASRTAATARRSTTRPARCAAIAAHHDERLDRTEAALGAEPRSGYEVSHDLFGRELAADPAAVRRRRDALAPRAARRRSAAPRGARTTGPSPILRRSAGGRAPL